MTIKLTVENHEAPGQNKALIVEAQQAVMDHGQAAKATERTEIAPGCKREFVVHAGKELLIRYIGTPL